MSDDGAARGRGPFGPLEQLEGVQRQAIEAALRITAELGSLTGGLADATWLRGSNGAGGTTSPEDPAPVDVGRLRSDVARATETFADLLRAVLDIGFDAMDELARRPAARAGGAAAPGGVARLTGTVRNGPEPATGLRAHVPQLCTVDGTVLGAAVAIDPAAFDLEAHERTTLTVTVAVPGDARPGRYHGLLLVAGLPDAAHPVTLDIEPGGAS